MSFSYQLNDLRARNKIINLLSCNKIIKLHNFKVSSSATFKNMSVYYVHKKNLYYPLYGNRSYNYYN